MVGTRLIRPVLPRLLHHLVRLVTLPVGMAEVDLVRLEARLMILLVEAGVVETDSLMSMACSLLTCGPRVHHLMMRSCVKGVDETALVHLRGTVCHASIDVVRFFALILCKFAKFAWSAQPETQCGGPGPDRRSQDGPEGRKDDQKAKCKSITLEKEPAPNQLRAWIVDLKDKVANAFAYDTEYALKWVEIPENADYESLSAPCKYGNLENEFNAALRQCVTSPPLTAKVGMEPERMHSLSKRLVSRQILWVLYEHLRPHITGDATFKMIEFMRLSSDRFTKGTEEERLEAFMNKRDSVLAGITVDRPPEHVLTALFYEQIHTFKCLALDMALWQRDPSVRNYAYLRSVATNAVQTWRMRNNQERMYHATRNSSGSPRVLAVQRGSSGGRNRSRSFTPGGRRCKKSTPKRKGSRSHTPPGGRRRSSPHRAAPVRHGSPNRRGDRSRSNTRSPNGRFVCRDFQRGICARMVILANTHTTRPRVP